MAAERLARTDGRLDVDLAAGVELAERRPRQRLWNRLERDLPVVHGDRVRQQPATDTESPTAASAAVPGASTTSRAPSSPRSELHDAAKLANDAGEHAVRLARAPRLGPVREVATVDDTRDVARGKDAGSVNMRAYWRD